MARNWIITVSPTQNYSGAEEWTWDAQEEDASMFEPHDYATDDSHLMPYRNEGTQQDAYAAAKAAIARELARRTKVATKEYNPEEDSDGTGD